MSILIANITLAILIFGIYIQLKVWKIRALISPGFYFSVIWSLGVIGLLVFKSVGILIETYPKYIDELNILVAFTSVCFTFFVKKGKKKVNDTSYIDIKFIKSILLYKFLSVFYLLLAIYVFFVEGQGLNFGLARDNVHGTLENRSFIVGYFGLLAIPLSLYAGMLAIKKIQNKSSIKLNWLFILFPFMGGTLFSFTVGGRVDMVYSLLLYVVGAIVTVPITFNIIKHKKLLFTIFIVAFSLNLSISWVDAIRAEYGGRNDVMVLIKNKLGAFSFLYGSVNYVQSSYVGYQYRRVDAVDENELGYGIYTFNGFINWTLPFSSRIGLENFSIADAFDVRYYNQETYDFSRKYFDRTHSSYIPIIKDFGFKGAFFAIFLIVYISHSLFIQLQRRNKISYATTFFVFYLFFDYWTKSNFYGTLSSSILVPLYSFLVIDIINYWSKTTPGKSH